jgi:hypothetical protein
VSLRNRADALDTAAAMLSTSDSLRGFVAHVVSLRLGFGDIARTGKTYSVAGAGSTTAWTWGAGSSTWSFTTAFRILGAAFRAFGFAAFT